TLHAATTAIVVPDAGLHLLPFEALVFEPRAAHHGARFWLDDGPAVRYASSASSWLALETRRARGGRAVTSSAPSVCDPRFAVGAHCPALPAPRLESGALVTALGPAPVTVLSGDSATEEAVRRELPRARLLHFATHGFVTSRRSDVLAGLVLAAPADSGAAAENDGLLQLYEIYSLPLDAELAVLSACDTARGARVSGEGVFALSRGFLAAGP